MATIPDSVKTRLDTDWAIGTGGVEPTYYVEEDIRMRPPTGQDYILVQSSTLDTDPKPFNDIYTNEAHVLSILVNTLTSEDRLKEIGDEVVRVLNATAITDITYQRLKRRKILSGIEKGVFNYQERITYDLIEQMKESAASYGAGAGTNLDDLLMYGSTHAAWVPCVFYIEGATSVSIGKVFGIVGTIENVDAQDFNLFFLCPLPTNKGSLKLYVGDVRVGILDADASNKLDALWVYGMKYNTQTSLNADGTDRTAAGSYTSAFVVTDVSSYNSVFIRVAAVVTNAGDFNLSSLELECYYA